MSIEVSSTPLEDDDTARAFVTDTEKRTSTVPSSDIADRVDDEEFCVTLEPHEDPKNIPNWRKWMIVFILASGAHCAACASTVVSYIHSHAVVFHVDAQ